MLIQYLISFIFLILYLIIFFVCVFLAIIITISVICSLLAWQTVCCSKMIITIYIKFCVINIICLVLFVYTDSLSRDIGVANCTLYTISCGSVAGIF